jgi:hypothetical protein
MGLGNELLKLGRSIWTVSKGLGVYYSKGLDTPQEISKSYCPPSASDWARKVSFVMSDMGK